MKKTIYWKTIKQINLKWLFILVLNILFFATLYFGLIIFNKLIEKLDLEKLMETKILIAQSIESMALEETQFLSQQLTYNITLLVLYIFAFTLFLLISYSIFNYFLYKQVYKNKYKTKNLLKYLASNVVAGMILLLANIQAFKIIRPNIAPLILIIELIILIYIFTLFNLFFFKENKIFSSIKLIYFLTITKLHRLLPAFGLIILTYVILNIPFYIINIFVPALWIYLIPLLLSLTFNRYYLKNVLETKNIKSILKS